MTERVRTERPKFKQSCQGYWQRCLTLLRARIQYVRLRRKLNFLLSRFKVCRRWTPVASLWRLQNRVPIKIIVSRSGRQTASSPKSAVQIAHLKVTLKKQALGETRQLSGPGPRPLGSGTTCPTSSQTQRVDKAVQGQTRGVAFAGSVRHP